jgi:protein involved in polysaccharide export with SLBB domain
MSPRLLFALLCSGLSLTSTSGVGAQLASRNASLADSSAFAQPGDIVRLKIWREPDMSGDFIVDAAGVATLPRLGALSVSRMGADSLQRLLVSAYARYLKNPSVEVVLMRRVRVVGAVRTPGLYTADPTMHVRDVLALAGGATPEGRTDVVRLDRNGRSTPVDLDRAPRAGEIGLRSGDQLYVPQRSWLARNTPLIAAIVSVSGGLLIALSTR